MRKPAGSVAVASENFFTRTGKVYDRMKHNCLCAFARPDSLKKTENEMEAFNEFNITPYTHQNLRNLRRRQMLSWNKPKQRESIHFSLKLTS